MISFRIFKLLCVHLNKYKRIAYLLVIYAHRIHIVHLHMFRLTLIYLSIYVVYMNISCFHYLIIFILSFCFSFFALHSVVCGCEREFEYVHEWASLCVLSVCVCFMCLSHSLCIISIIYLRRYKLV